MGLALVHEEEHEEEHEKHGATMAPPAALGKDGHAAVGEDLEFVYGVNGVETRALDRSVNEEELGLFISVTSDVAHAAQVSTGTATVHR